MRCVGETADEATVPASARWAVRLAFAAAAAGLLLIVAGLLDLHWWSTSSATGLRRVMEHVRVEYGDQPPAMLRSGGGAVQLIVLGACCLPYAVLAPLLRQGRRWARTAGLLLGLATALFGLIEIGVDAIPPVDLHAYLAALTNKGATDSLPQLHALIYPAGYSWFEDLAQGLQTVASLAVALALVAVTIWHPDLYAGKRSAAAPPDEWSAAITRIRDQNKRRREETGLED
jgi:hypothetical protein